MIKYLLNLIKAIIFENPLKITFMVVSIISFYFAGSFQNSTKKIEVVSQTKRGPDYVYTVVNKGTSDGYDIVVSDKEEKIIDGCLIKEDYNDVNVLFWILFGISTIILVVATFIGIVGDDDDISWNIQECKKSAAQSLLYCELENNTFYYMALGRLIQKSNTQLDPYRVKCDSLEYIKKCPKFSTKTQKRNNLLDSIGI